MFSLKIENAKGEIFELTHDTQNYAIIGIEGLTPPPTIVNTSTGGTLDGTFHNSSRLEQRNIVITIHLRGDIEGNRQHLYKVFNLKKPCKVYFRNENRNVKIKAYVETLEGDLFENGETIQISLICPRPYFEDLETIYTQLSKIIKMFEFPFYFDRPEELAEITAYPQCSIINSGDVECGCVIKIEIDEAVTDLNIYNTTRQEYLSFEYEFAANDEITISTVSGDMFARILRNGEQINLLNFVKGGSTWFKLDIGENIFTFSVTSGSVDSVSMQFENYNLYGGV